MSLFGKEPVDKPCEAGTFEEAAQKNRARLAHERDGCASLHEEMKAKGEPGFEGMDPAFWIGAQAANERAFLIYQEELAVFLSRMSVRLEELKGDQRMPKGEQSGWRDVMGSWAKALEKNDPSIIVYW